MSHRVADIAIFISRRLRAVALTFLFVLVIKVFISNEPDAIAEDGDEPGSSQTTISYSLHAMERP